MNKVPKVVFDGPSLELEERLRTFQTLAAPYYDAIPLGELADFNVSATAYRAGDLLFNKVEFSPLRFRRGASQLAGHMGAPITLEVQLTGEQQVTMPQGQFRMLPERIYLRDWGFEFESFATAMRLNSVSIPREKILVASRRTKHYPVLSWSLSEPRGRMLALLWSQLLAEFETVGVEEADGLCRGFISFLKSLLGHDDARKQTTTVGAMQQFLSARLQGDVGVEDLCEHFRVSRATVFRLFKDLGGVRQHIVRSKLERCYNDLLIADPSRTKVADVARSWGFTDPSSFSRSFRGQFGIAPSEVMGKEAVLRSQLVFPKLPRSVRDRAIRGDGKGGRPESACLSRP